MSEQPVSKPYAPIPAPAECIVHVTFTKPEWRRLYAKDQSLEDVFPEQATLFSVGCDLRACLEQDQITVAPGERVEIGTGIAIQIQSGGIGAFVYSRSGLGATMGFIVAQGVGVVDPDYTGELKTYMLNTSDKPIVIKRGDRIAQLTLQPFLKPKWHETRRLEETVRGDGSFGHSGLM